MELGSDYINDVKAFNGDGFRTNKMMSKSGKARRLTSFEFEFTQAGDSEWRSGGVEAGGGRS